LKEENQKLLDNVRNNPDSNIYKYMQQIYKWQEKQHEEFENYMKGLKEENE